MKKKTHFLFVVLLLISGFAQMTVAGTNRIALSFGFKHENQKLNKNSTELNNYSSGFVSAVSYERFLGSNLSLGIEVTYSPLGNQEQLFEENMFIMPIIVNFSYYLAPGKFRPYTKIGVGPLLGTKNLERGNELFENTHLMNNVTTKRMDKFGLKPGFAAEFLSGISWQFFKGVGIYIEAGLFHEYLEDSSLPNGKLFLSSFIGRLGLQYEF